MSIAKLEKPRRRRRAPDEARREAVDAARALLLSGGPTAVTLSAVAADIGVTHANLIHHFGSAAGLQSALMGSMVADLGQALETAVTRLRTDDGAPMELINAVFDAFAEGGAGRLAAWIALSGDLTHLDPVRDAVNNLVNAIAEKMGDDGEARERIGSAVLFIALSAFGEALIGPPLRAMLDQPDDAGRKVVASLLPSFIRKPSPEA
ncbi:MULTISPECIES: TetR/AcrR family transcriptional regulator [Brevundimonas]|jgi:AcrR family transcriptional regulator|uniref:TetR/AcrR family transcriptional regulator n=1 Tax=Brevundimonas TaxID=41275 RepID=UPI000E09FF2E|nr:MULTISPECIES: TetR/AcrR family transcriptional regulator [Brevundimonas]NWE52220.1 TetR/AcrR family transcriptional regulator [Brevundimonas sp. P7753]WQE36477.1 TetR/AcrR family transcriptional regulator [Brevundimonas bullata]